jgi:STE24 endopeptidase
MTADLIFNLIVLFVILGFILDRWLSFLNTKNWKSDIPEEMKDYYHAEKYEKARQYDKAHSKFGLISSIFSLIAILLMLCFDGFDFVDAMARKHSENAYLLPMIFFGILLLASDIISMPFSIYSTFVIEEKFGFNKTTPKTFVLDKIKGYLIGIILGGGILSAFIWFYESIGDGFWLAVWIFMAAFSIFMVMFYTSLIVPLFNKLTPLEDGELRKGIESYCTEVGFKLSNLFVIDGSKRSSKSNAYFSGLGPKKKIVLFDTLIEKQENNEIIAVLAHEIGHYKLKHTLTAVVISILQTGFMLFLLSLVIKSPLLGNALGVENMSLHIGLIAFSLLYSPISTITGIFLNILSRKNEFQADAYAAETNDGNQLIKALKKLSVDNLSNLYPHPAYVFVHHSHPPILKRIEAIKKQMSGI